MMDLERWRKLWDSLDGQGGEREVFELLVRAYGEGHRRYHDGGHLDSCLQILDRLPLSPPLLHLVETALWFHDVVYDTRAQDNEEQSVLVARQCLSGGEVTRRKIDHIEELIMATKHGLSCTVEGGDIIVDVDLAILGAPPGEFWAYEEAIREEYHWVEESQYRLMRAHVMGAFLEGESIYHTPEMVREREEQARSNIKALLARLKGT